MLTKTFSQRTMTAVEHTECLFISKDTLELAVGKLSSILDKDKIRRSRKDRISEARKTAPVCYVKFILYPQTDSSFPSVEFFCSFRERPRCLKITTNYREH